MARERMKRWPANTSGVRVRAGAPGPGSPACKTRLSDAVNEHGAKCSKSGGEVKRSRFGCRRDVFPSFRLMLKYRASAPPLVRYV